jgi:thiol-disulfide isomerase/thioredoxin
MKNIISILIVSFLFSCNKSESVKEILQNKRTSSQITLIFRSIPKQEFIPLSQDSIIGGRSYFENLAYYNDSYGLKHKISAKQVFSNNAINILVQGKFIEINFFQKKLSELSFQFKKGDSILVDYSDDGTPNINVLNRDIQYLDYNLYKIKDSILKEKQKISSFEEYFKYIQFPNKPMNIEDTQLFIKEKQRLAGNNFIKNLIKENLLLDSLFKTNSLSNEAYDYYQSKNHYIYLSYLAKEKMLPYGHKIDYGIEDKSMNLSISQSKLDYENFKDLIKNNDSLLDYSYSKEFFEYYFFPKYFEDASTKTTTRFQKFGSTHFEYNKVFDSIITLDILSKKEKDYYLYTYMSKIANNLDSEITIEYYKKFKEIVSDKIYVDAINGEFGLDKSNSTSLRLLDISGSSKTLEDIINANNEKIIHVTFWATWCLPCIKQLPNLDSLRSNYKENDIVFINISIENDFQSWKLNKNNILLINVEHNYTIDNFYTSKIIKDNYIYYVPRYLVYDKNGVLINNDAPPPDSEYIYELLDKLLSQ